jgi:glycerol-3-phosphate dehydrogenase
VTQSTQVHDLLVIGGGINGAGVAADAAGRGLDVVLCEQADLAQATSSASTKMIHGGLRYLENYEFALVHKALKERELLSDVAQHIIQPIPIVIPHLLHLRPTWMVRMGLFLYDHLARRRRFKGSRHVRFDLDGPLRPELVHGYEYWDAQVDDSLLVILNAVQAREKGARVLTRTECIALEALDTHWRIQLKSHLTGQMSELKAKAVVNASGPWVGSLAGQLTGKVAKHKVRLVKGSHIVIPRFYEYENAFLMQHADGRVIFVIPYQGRFTLIGTTEEEIDDSLEGVEISEQEIDYLINVTNKYFKRALSRTRSPA